MPIRFDPSRVLQSIEQLKVQGIPGAIRRAMTRATNSGSVALARDVASDTGLKVSVVKEQLRTEVVDTETGLVGRISVSGKRIPLIDFNARGQEPSRGRGRGVSANTGGGRKTYPGAFITTMQSGHRGVFHRQGSSVRTSRGAWSRNLPVVELKGPSLPNVVHKKSGAAIARFQEQFPKELQREVTFAIKKAASS